MAHISFRDLPPWKRKFEVISSLLTFYSLICLFIELECGEAHRSTGWWLFNERVIATVFTLEFLFRWSVSHDPRRHLLRPMAIIDLISILPFYIGFFVDPASLGAIRSLRAIRILRLCRYTDAFATFGEVFRRVRSELFAVATTVVIAITVSSVAVFECEKGVQPDKIGKFSDAVWWCFVTITTVGYGDIAPVTLAGRGVAILTMIFGVCNYGVLLSLFGGAWIDTLKARREAQARRESVFEDDH